MQENYDPSTLSDEDLKDVFWAIDKDEYPENYEKICIELDNRKIPYKDISQWERKQINLEVELETISYVFDKVRDTLRIGRAMSSLGVLFGESIGHAIRKVFKFVLK